MDTKRDTGREVRRIVREAIEQGKDMATAVKIGAALADPDLEEVNESLSRARWSSER